jgi:hypothetical protein
MPLVKPKSLNVYIWEPEDIENYGRLGFTATPAACQVIAKTAEAVVRVAAKYDFELPGTTEGDVDHIGGGIRLYYRRLTIGPVKAPSNLIKVALDNPNRSLRISVSRESLHAFVGMLGEVAKDSGDAPFDVVIDDKEEYIFYWPCFGHTSKSSEPQNRFPE